MPVETSHGAFKKTHHESLIGLIIGIWSLLDVACLKITLVIWLTCCSLQIQTSTKPLPGGSCLPKHVSGVKHFMDSNVSSPLGCDTISSCTSSQGKSEPGQDSRSASFPYGSQFGPQFRDRADKSLALTSSQLRDALKIKNAESVHIIIL